MVFTTAGGGATQLIGDFVTNSLRLNDDDSPYLERSLSSPNTDKFTVSCWVKLCGGRSQIANIGKRLTGEIGDSRSIDIEQGAFSDGRLGINAYNGVADANVAAYNSSSGNGPLIRDSSAWYHFVYAFDTGQGTAANRFKWYINGVLQSGYNTTTTPSQNADLFDSSGSGFRIGRAYNTETRYADMYVAEYYYVDGQQYDHTYFGEFNDNGVWVPVENGKGAGGAITFGTNGFYLQFKETGTSANASGIGADTSGNDNHLTPTNLAALDITTDTPQNNFCTWNPLANKFAGSTFSEGNCYLTMADSVSTFNAGTFGLTSGKWYWETKVINIGSGSDNFLVGAVSRPDSGGTTDYLGEPTSVVYRNNGNIKKDSANATHGASYGVNDIVMVALDCDNDNIYFGSNGNWADGSGNNDESSPTSAVAFTNTMINDGIVFPAQGDLHGNTPNPIASTNFGNPPHSISSGNSDANGYGNFEYAVPSGYYALCTKNQAAYG